MVLGGVLASEIYFWMQWFQHSRAKTRVCGGSVYAAGKCPQTASLLSVLNSVPISRPHTNERLRVGTFKRETLS